MYHQSLCTAKYQKNGGFKFIGGQGEVIMTYTQAPVLPESLLNFPIVSCNFSNRLKQLRKFNLPCAQSEMVRPVTH